MKKSIKKNSDDLNIYSKKENSYLDFKENSNIEKRQNKQAFFILISLVLILLLFIGVFFGFKYLGGRFNYQCLEFKKVQIGAITLYKTIIPIYENNIKVRTYEINFKYDPRETMKIPISERTSEEGVKFVKENNVIVSINPNMTPCQDNNLALLTLGAFLKDSGLKVVPAMTDKTWANISNYPYIICENSSRNTVIIVTDSNLTEIKQTLTNCYEIRFADCQIMSSTERFILEIIIDYIKKLNIKSN